MREAKKNRERKKEEKRQKPTEKKPPTLLEVRAITTVCITHLAYT